MTAKRKICIEFDNVIHQPKAPLQNPTVIDGDLVPGSIDFLVSAVSNFNVAIFSWRSASYTGHHVMKLWTRDMLEREGLGMVWRFINWPTQKPLADVFIEPRAWAFAGSFPTMSTLATMR